MARLLREGEKHRLGTGSPEDSSQGATETVVGFRQVFPQLTLDGPSITQALRALPEDLWVIPDSKRLTANAVSAILSHMVNSRTQQLDETFFALSDPTRRRMLARLSGGDMTVAELSEPFDVSAPAVSKHLRVLERAGLLTRDRDGRVRRCHLVAEPLKEAAGWVEKYRCFWETQLDQLAEYLEQSTTKPK